MLHRVLGRTGLAVLGLVLLSHPLSGQTCPVGDQCGDLTKPLIQFTPLSGTTFVAAQPQSVTLTVRWSDDVGLSSATRTITFNGQTVTSSFGYSGTATSATSAGTVTLAPGTNTLTAHICDTSNNCQTTSATYTQYIVTVTVSPHAASQSAGPGASLSQSFTVTNTGNVESDFALGVSCTAPLVSCAAPTLAHLLAGQSTNVVVTFGTGTSAGTGRATLTAAYTADNTIKDVGYVDVAVVIPQSFTVSVGPDGGMASANAGTASTQAFTVTNRGNTPATYNLAVSCSGAVGGCSVPLSVTVSAGASATATVSYTAGASAATGHVRLQATYGGNAAVADTGSVDVGVVSGTVAAPVVNVHAVNPGFTQDRGDCVRAFAAPRAESECFDLVLAHAAPAFRELNKTYAPTLIYNSATAFPHPTVMANVAVPAGAAAPNTVTAILTVDGAQVASTSWTGSYFTPGHPMRVSVGYDASSASTGLHPYSLQVTSNYASGSYSTTVSDTLVIVNRSYGPFGSGWWLAGAEWVGSYGAAGMLWVAGDGSTRIYRNSGVSGLWLADGANGTDSLVLVASSYYARKLRGGGEVRFSGTTGQQIATVNRLGFTTIFNWSAASNGYGMRLDNISLPMRSDFNTGYAFVFGYPNTASPPTSITSPGTVPGQSRTLQIGLTGWQVASFTDPDGAVQTFGYVPGTARVGWMVDARGSRTDFVYHASAKLNGANRYAGGATSIPGKDAYTGFWGPETRGYMGGTPVDTTWAYAIINGPRDDVADAKDETDVWVNGAGAPTRITDALNNSTWIYREDPRFPEAVTRVDAPAAGNPAGTYSPRLVSYSYLNAIGDVDSTVVANPLGDGRNARTWYEYGDTRWPHFVTKVTTPLGLVAQTGYDASGNAVWQQAGPDPARRVNAYYGTLGQVDSVWSAAAQGRGERPSRYTYDGFTRNLTATTTPLVMSMYLDAAGRDTLVVAPIQQSAGTQTTQRTAYDAMGRPLVSSTTALGQTVTVTTAYDSAGLVRSTTRTMSPDTNHIGAMTITYVYDKLGRVVREISPDNRSDSLEYNPAGLVITDVTKRSSQFGPTNVIMKYDAAGRLVQRTTPSFGYGTRHLADFGRNWDFPSQPLDPDAPSSPNVLPGDTAVFTYDARGNILTANNHDARVTRTYLPGGALAGETQAIRTYTGADFTQHVYTVGYHYGLDGRRTALKHPSNLAPATGQDSVAYAYSSTTGELVGVTDPLGNAFAFQYDSDGRMWQRTAPGGITETSAFDADDRTIRRTMVSTSLGTLFADTLQYDDRDKVIQAGGQDPATLTYTGMGAVKKFTDLRAGFYSNDTKIIDPLGNLAWNDRRWATDGANGKNQTQQSFSYQMGTGRQLEMDEYSALDGHVTDQDLWSYDAAGNRDWHLGSHAGSSDANGSRLVQERMQSYYGADDRLRVVDRQRCLTQVVTGQTSSGTIICGVWDETLGQDPSAFEEYRYEALGRRVLVRRRLYEVNGSCLSYYHTCTNAIERFVYDGDQILWEIRTPTSFNATSTELESDAGSGDFGGRVGYTHGGGIDAPLDLIRVGHSAGLMAIVPHANWRGMYSTGTFASGSTNQGTFATNQIAWPGPNANEWHNSVAPGQPSNWFGSLIMDQRDASGLMHRRNRQYDPATGRFTQEDPIGLAGGLNLYGFGGGDAVNYSDPFGLTVTCTYEQKSGRLVCTDDKTGKVVVDQSGYSGKGEGKNNPYMQEVKNTGPIPTGRYTISATATNRKGPVTISLSPDASNEMFDRSAFLIHGESIAHPGAASEGCIIMPRPVRETINKAGGGRLEVKSGLPSFPTCPARGFCLDP